MIDTKMIEEAHFLIAQLQSKQIKTTIEVLSFLKKNKLSIPKEKIEEVYQYFGATRKVEGGSFYEKCTAEGLFLIAVFQDDSTSSIYFAHNNKLEKNDVDYIEKTLNVKVLTINDTLKQLVSM